MVYPFLAIRVSSGPIVVALGGWTEGQGGRAGSGELEKGGKVTGTVAAVVIKTVLII